MTKFMPSALGARRLSAVTAALAVTLIGSILAASPAQAASMSSPSVTSPAPLNAGQVNPAPITITFTAPTAIAGSLNNSTTVQLSGASWVSVPSPGTPCGVNGSASNNTSIPITCVFATVGGKPAIVAQSTGSTAWPANTSWTFVLGGGQITLPTTGTMDVGMVTMSTGSPVDSTSYPVSLVGGTQTVTFDANGGTGTMTEQSASSATPLSSNAFTRSGYSFAGWNTVADGSGTSYGDGASFAFDSSVTLYAQWESSLASTGVDQSVLGITLAIGSLLLAAGGVLALRRRTA